MKKSSLRRFGALALASFATFAIAAGCGSVSSSDDEPVGSTQDPLALQADAGTDVDGSVHDASVQQDATVDAPDEGACRNVELDASVSYVPIDFWHDGNEIFVPPFEFSIPANIPVTAGNAGDGYALFTFVEPSLRVVTCVYRGGATVDHPTTTSQIAAGELYDFDDCDNGAHAGDLETAALVTLHVQSGDVRNAAGETAVRFGLEQGGACRPGDAASDVAVDAPVDARPDVNDAAEDLGADVAADAPLDAPADAPVDAPADVAVDAPSCTAASCDDGNPCTTDTCQANGTCAHTNDADGTTCTGSNKCEQTYACLAGVCTGSRPVTCTASDECHLAGTCDPSSGVCSNPTATNGATCNDGNACTQSDSC
jgi:hypothetical protein